MFILIKLWLFLHFFFFFPAGFCLSAVIWNDFFFFWTLFMCKPWSVAGRTEHEHQWVSNIYSQSERIVQGSVKNTNTARILFWWVTRQQLVLPSNKFSSVSASSFFFWSACSSDLPLWLEGWLRSNTVYRLQHNTPELLIILSHWNHKSLYCCALWKQCEQCAFRVVRAIHPSKRVCSASH